MTLAELFALGGDELVTVVWDRRDRGWTVCGRVRLDSGVGQHIVDVSVPDAPCLLRKSVNL